MSVRNNLERTGAPPDSGVSAIASQMSDPLKFVTPTTFVELPSLGKGYPTGHSLHNKEVIEIRYMTAKDEDILTSQALLKKGLAIERMMENIIIDKSIKPKDLLIGDRNAILIAARISAYGRDYETNIACPACGERSNLLFNLEDITSFEGEVVEELGATSTDNGTFIIRLPLCKLDVEVKLLTGEDEQYLLQLMKNRKKHKLQETNLTDQYVRMIVSINGNGDLKVKKYLIDNMTALDSRHLRTTYKKLSPDVKVFKDFTCDACGHDQAMEVPFNADFFWPDR